MSVNLQAVRGMHDILPDMASRWRQLEAVLGGILCRYGYREIRLPLVEQTELFKRSIGEVTDIVEKEMFTFEDRSGDSLTLRPEGTAGCLRACLEHGLLYNQVQRLWYSGPMFRHERPQQGRYRQFHQLGVEAYGLEGPDIDAEIILMTRRFWMETGVAGHVSLQINSLGTIDERQRYRSELVRYLEGHYAALDEDSRRRLHGNPLRILDSKNPALTEIITAAPGLLDYLGDESLDHFQRLQAQLSAAGVAFHVNTRLVRGLDYYGKTVFEWVTDALGAQGTVCAGGRYDLLVQQFGGKPPFAVGFAMGLERLLLLMEQCAELPTADPLHAYLIAVGGVAEARALELAETLRDQLPALRMQVNLGGGSFKSQFKRADKSGARYALIVGEDEVAANLISIKPLRDDSGQATVAAADAAAYLAQRL